MMASNRSSVQPASIIRKAIKDKRTLIALGAHDALSAALVQRFGFDVVYVGSYTTEAAAHLHPDVGLMSKSDRRAIVDHISQAVSLPVFADVEEGYGGPIAVANTVEEFERAGAAMIHLDDQISPGVCPYLPGVPRVTLLEAREMCQKIEAAVNARKGDMLIVARPDISGLVEGGAYSPDQRNEAVRRSNEYLSAGADAILIGTFTKDDILWFADRIKGPVIGLFEDALPHSVGTFREAGYLMVMGPTLLLFAALKGMTSALEAFRQSEDWNAARPYLATAEAFYDIIEWKKYLGILQKNADQPLAAR